MNVRGLDHVNVVVSDIEKSKAWYCDTLNCTVQDAFRISEPDLSRGLGVPDAVLDVAFLLLPSSTTRIEMVQYVSPQASPTDVSRANSLGFGHFALEVEDVRATYDELVAKGVAFVSPPVDVNGTVRFCWFLDPDGNRVEIIQFDVDTA